MKDTDGAAVATVELVRCGNAGGSHSYTMPWFIDVTVVAKTTGSRCTEDNVPVFLALSTVYALSRHGGLAPCPVGLEHQTLKATILV